MSSRHQFRWRVFFGDGTPARDVIASSEASAKQTAHYAERVIGNRKSKRPLSAHCLFPVGLAAQEQLFPQPANDEALCQPLP